MKFSNLLLVFFTLSLLSACTYFHKGDEIASDAQRTFYDNGRVKSIIEHKDGKYHGKVMNYGKDGKLISKVYYKAGEKDGTSINYYPSGKVHSEISYKENKKDGLTKWYYENGKPYRITKYNDGVKDSIETKLYENGKVMSRMPYKNGKAGTGLKEYNKAGNDITPDYKITVTEIDKTLLNGVYLLHLNHTGNTKKVEYYQDKLADNQYIPAFANKVPMDNGMGEITIFLKRGQVIMTDIPIIAKIKTKLGNYYVTTLNYNLAVQN